jgi:uncharacterized protein (TIGR00299 family) protein
MRYAYFDCQSGAAGDMIVAALLDAGAAFEPLRAAADALGLQDVQLDVRDVKRGGFAGKQFTVNVPDGDHAHRTLGDILAIVEGSTLSSQVKADCARVFERLGEAEAKVHGRPSARDTHFHEVGAKDAIVDVVCACVALEQLGVDQVLFSDLTTGYGEVRCAHGVLPVPAPGTLALLEGVSCRDGDVEGERLTPTGAAVLTTLGAHAKSAPAMHLEASGCGAGLREMEGRSGMLRVRVGTAAACEHGHGDVWVLETNIDDMHPEQTAYASEKILTAGALDVFLTPIYMKKGRPGVLMTVLCTDETVGPLSELVLEQTTSFGLRMHRTHRRVLAREMRSVETAYGSIRVKVGLSSGRIVRVSPEFEDCRSAADAAGVPIETVYAAARAAFGDAAGDAPAP